MPYEVKTPVFEGPLDLLLQLITSHRLDVTDLSLSELVAEYLSYLGLMQELDLEVTSEFVVIAATLVQLKARSLLPEDSDIELDEDLLLSEERDRLLSRLLANLTFKDVAAVFAARLETASLLLPRTAGLDIEVDPPPIDVRIPLDAAELGELADRVLARFDAEPELDHLELDLPSVSDAIADLRVRIARALETDFATVTDHLASPTHVVAYFLAVLELARWGLVEARQDGIDDPIRLTATGQEQGALVSEWDISEPA